MESFEELTLKNASSSLADHEPPQPPESIDHAQTTVPVEVGQQTEASNETEADMLCTNPLDFKEGQLQNDSPTYPQLSYNPADSLKDAGDERATEDDDEEPRLATSFERLSSPTSALQRNRGAMVGKVGDEGVARMHKFTLYETATYFYIVGADLLDSAFRILKIDRTAELGELNVAEDYIVYTKKETNQILNAIDEGNQSTGGLKLKTSFWGLLGFIRFTGPYYMIFITKRVQVAMIGGHYIYRIDGTELVPLAPAGYGRVKPDRNPEETRFVSILNNLD